MLSSVWGRKFPPQQIQQLFKIMLLVVSLRYNEYLGMIDTITLKQFLTLKYFSCDLLVVELLLYII